MLEVARDMTPAREESAWTERVAELRSTLLRRTGFDDVPVKPQRVYEEAKLGAPEKRIAGDYSFRFLTEEVAVAVQDRVPFVLVMVNNTYMGLIRQAEKYGYDENYAVDLSYDNGDTVGIDHVAVMEAMGAMGRRVTEPGDIADTLRWAVAASEERRLPVLVEIMTERDTDAAMGVAIDAINEYEPILDRTYEHPGAVVGALPERD
jgi:tartronate-semialdehyde synthase